VLVDQQATLGVEERGPDWDRSQITLQRSLPILPAELVLRLTPRARRDPGDGVCEPGGVDPDPFRQLGGAWRSCAPVRCGMRGSVTWSPSRVGVDSRA
jgi:hypothetical protein